MLTTLATGSRGNLYEIYDGNTRLLIECGLPIAKIRKLTEKATTEYAACIVTHEHMDHAAAVHDIDKLGIPLYMTRGTALALEVHACNVVTAGEQIEIGSYSIMPFSTVHDAAEPIGMILYSHETDEKLLFVTDTAYVPCRGKGLTEIAIECNHSIEMLRRSKLHPKVKERIAHTHMSLTKTMDALAANDLSQVEKIHLLHLSSKHGNADEFVAAVWAQTKIPTEVG